ncbi:MAG: hypothetical protein U0350_37920 [Caldilineaceae bacterium]
MQTLQTGWHDVQPEGNKNSGKVVGKIIGAALAIFGAMTFLGALFTIIGIALREFLAYIAVKATNSLLDLLFGLGRMFWHVLVGSVNGAVDGLSAGFAAGLAAGLVYLITQLFIAPRLPVKHQRPVVALLVALAGGLGASFGCKGILADYALWAGLVGGLLGLLTSLIMLPRRTTTA